MRQPSDFEQARDREFKRVESLPYHCAHRIKDVAWLYTILKWSTFEMLLHYDEEDELANQV